MSVMRRDIFQRLESAAQIGWATFHAAYAGHPLEIFPDSSRSYKLAISEYGVRLEYRINYESAIYVNDYRLSFTEVDSNAIWMHPLIPLWVVPKLVDNPQLLGTHKTSEFLACVARNRTHHYVR